MYCVKCFHETTSVINSRPSKKQPHIWRRRKCPECGIVFTTRERPSLADNKQVYVPRKDTTEFNLGKLIISISKAFTHAPELGETNALWLAQTIEDALSTQQQLITPEDIEVITHQVLKRFDELAAVQYAAQHQLIVSTRRRGRPSWREQHEPPIHE